MHVMRALVSVHRLQVHHVADDVILIDDAVAAVHVAGHPRDIQRLAAVVALQQADHLRRGVVLVHQPPEPQHRVQAERDLGLHVRQLLLDQLRRRQRAAEHHALQRVLPRRMPAELRRAQRAPGNAVARVVEAGERAAQPLDRRQPVLRRDEHVLHHDHAGDRCPQREFPLDLRLRQARHAAFQDEAADVAGIVLRPHHQHVGDRRVGDPGLRAVQQEPAIHRLRPACASRPGPSRHPARSGRSSRQARRCAASGRYFSRCSSDPNA